MTPIYDLIYVPVDDCYYAVPRDGQGKPYFNLDLLAAGKIPASGLYAITRVPTADVVGVLHKQMDKWDSPLV